MEGVPWRQSCPIFSCAGAAHGKTGQLTLSGSSSRMSTNCGIEIFSNSLADTGEVKG